MEQGSCRAISNKEDVPSLNEFLDMIQAKVYDARRKLIGSGTQVTYSALMDIISGQDQRGKMLLAIFKEHNNRTKALIGKDYTKGTYKKFETALQHTRSYIRWKYKQEDINIHALNSDFVNELSFWFETIRHCGHNTTMKYITNIKRVALQCVDNSYLKEGLKTLVRKGKKEVLSYIFNFATACCEIGLLPIDLWV